MVNSKPSFIQPNLKLNQWNCIGRKVVITYEGLSFIPKMVEVNYTKKLIVLPTKGDLVPS